MPGLEYAQYPGRLYSTSVNRSGSTSANAGITGIRSPAAGGANLYIVEIELLAMTASANAVSYVLAMATTRATATQALTAGQPYDPRHPAAEGNLVTWTTITTPVASSIVYRRCGIVANQIGAGIRWVWPEGQELKLLANSNDLVIFKPEAVANPQTQVNVVWYEG